MIDRFTAISAITVVSSLPRGVRACRRYGRQGSAAGARAGLELDELVCRRQTSAAAGAMPALQATGI